MSAPLCLRGRPVFIVTTSPEENTADTVLRAWWRKHRVTGERRLTRVLLRKRGECTVTSLSVVGGDGQFATVPLIGVAK